jgi:hypothetical protein
MQRSRNRGAAALLCCGVAAVLGACHHSAIRLPDPATPGAAVVGAFEIDPDAGYPALQGTRFGGVSALAYDASTDELLGLSDDRVNSRIFRMKVYDEPFRVDPVGVVLLENAPGAPAKLDPEGLALLGNGHLLVSSEGIQNEEPRIPPGIIEYTHEGHFVRQLSVPPEFIPPATGPITHGVPNDEAFEALTLTPDGRALWTGEETSLVQDGPVATVDHGSRSRLLEYRLDRNGGFVPDREYEYDIDPVPHTEFGDTRIAMCGLTELLALSDRDFISMERCFVQEAAEARRGLDRIRLYRVTINGTEIPVGEDSIAARRNILPVSKTLLLDLGNSRNLPLRLAALDNFEGMAAMPASQPSRTATREALGTARPTVILVSDDNFSTRQRTWFVRVAFEPRLALRIP